MNILFTNITFKNYTGSEIVTLDQANYYADKGDSVYIFTLEAGKPLVSHLNPKVNIVNFENISQLNGVSFDFAICRQWPLLEYLIFSKGLRPKRIYFESVSWSLPIDFFPYFYKHLSLLGCVSERVKTTLARKGFDISGALVFSNYALPEFFQETPSLSSKPKNIAIVSNHPPKEIKEFVDYCNESPERPNVHLYGMGADFKLITARELNGYDVVISMGKTIFCSLAMGIPSYMYDTTCTTGYVTKENYSVSLKNNMASSMNSETRKTAIQILDEIESGYGRAIKENSAIKAAATKDFHFNQSMENLTSAILSSSPVDYTAMHAEYPFAKDSSSVFVPEIAFAKSEINRWYEESLRLGSMVQSEWDEKASLYSRIDELSQEIEAIRNSRTWKLIARITSPIRKLKSLFSVRGNRT